jgi:hypothetical protein
MHPFVIALKRLGSDCRISPAKTTESERELTITYGLCGLMI